MRKPTLGHLAGATTGLSVGVQADERIVPIARFGGPSVDALPRQPPRMDDQDADGEGSKEDEHPKTAGPRRGANNYPDEQHRLEQPSPAGSMFLEPPEVEVAKHEHRGADCDIKPVSVSPPHVDEPRRERICAGGSASWRRRILGLTRVPDKAILL